MPVMRINYRVFALIVIIAAASFGYLTFTEKAPKVGYTEATGLSMEKFVNPDLQVENNTFTIFNFTVFFTIYTTSKTIEITTNTGCEPYLVIFEVRSEIKLQKVPHYCPAEERTFTFPVDEPLKSSKSLAFVTNDTQEVILSETDIRLSVLLEDYDSTYYYGSYENDVFTAVTNTALNFNVGPNINQPPY